jgi:hypothetical protein
VTTERHATSNPHATAGFLVGVGDFIAEVSRARTGLGYCFHGQYVRISSVPQYLEANVVPQSWCCNVCGHRSSRGRMPRMAVLQDDGRYNSFDKKVILSDHFEYHTEPTCPSASLREF